MPYDDLVTSELSDWLCSFMHSGEPSCFLFHIHMIEVVLVRGPGQYLYVRIIWRTRVFSRKAPKGDSFSANPTRKGGEYLPTMHTLVTDDRKLFAWDRVIHCLMPHPVPQTMLEKLGLYGGHFHSEQLLHCATRHKARSKN
jgi:hypothetical protein